MDYKPGRQTRIDGIYASTGAKKPKSPLNKRAPLDYLTKPKQPMPKKRPRIMQNASTVDSVLNFNIPNPRYSEPLEPRLTKKLRFRRWRNWSKRRKFAMSALTILLIGFGFGAWYGSSIVGNLDKVFHGNVFSDVSALFSNTKLKGEDQGRVNILLAGDSSDDPGHGGADLTDSIMIVSIDTKNHTGFILSIPRDLWVYMPSFGNHQKINAANDDTSFSQAGYPNGGMGQLEQIVQTDLGIPIDYYALIDYSAFRDSVNAVGGITINLQSSDPRGVYDSFTNLKLPNGIVTLDGQEALDLARARGDDVSGDISYGLSSDFDRTQHQRQMLVALEQKASTAGVLTDPLKVTKLFDALGNNVTSDLSIQDALRLATLAKAINISKLQSLTYSETGTSALITDYTDPYSGQEALIPTAGIDNFGQIQQYYQKLTSSSPIVKESPSVVVLNASDVVGLARLESSTLSSKGYDVVATTDANSEHPSTMIVDNSNGQKPASLKALEQMYPGSVVTSTTGSSEAEEAAGYNADFVVILGQNWDGTSTPSSSQ